MNNLHLKARQSAIERICSELCRILTTNNPSFCTILFRSSLPIVEINKAIHSPNRPSRTKRLPRFCLKVTWVAKFRWPLTRPRCSSRSRFWKLLCSRMFTNLSTENTTILDSTRLSIFLNAETQQNKLLWLHLTLCKANQYPGIDLRWLSGKQS